MGRIRIGVIGAGSIAQLEHVPNLLRLKDRFEVIGIYDPSATARAFIESHYGVAGFGNLENLLDSPLDAVLIASPDPFHKEHALASLARSLHVFCEKPLCYSRADIEELIAARDASGRVLQVGYMKRFDPSYEKALELVPGGASSLRQVSVEVSDPDAWPFIALHPWKRADDVPRELVKETAEKQEAQVQRAIGHEVDKVTRRGFCGAYCSSLVHDVNAVHGFLEVLDVPAGEIVGASFYANGEGGQGAVKLLGGQALWSMMHLSVPSLPDYRERITFYFDDARLDLEFPSPYLNHFPTQLTLTSGNGDTLSRENLRNGFSEAFMRELEGFWYSAVEGVVVRNTAEQAARDMDLLCGLVHWQLGHAPQPNHHGGRA